MLHKGLLFILYLKFYVQGNMDAIASDCQLEEFGTRSIDADNQIEEIGTYNSQTF